MKKAFVKCAKVNWISFACVTLFLLWGNLAMAILPIQDARFTLQQSSVSLSQVFHEIEKQTGYSFLLRDNDVNTSEKVSINVKGKSVKEVLKILFTGKNIRYEVNGKFISVYRPQQSKQIVITSVVLDAAKEPIIGASVVVVNTANGCITDFEGNFSLEVDKLPIQLQITYIGYKPQIVTVKNTQTIQVTLHEDTEALDEVVIIGFGSQKKANLTGAVSSVKMDEIIGDRPIMTASDALQGTVPGLLVSASGNAPGSGKSFQLRGAYSIGIKNSDGSYGANVAPLILIDNVEGNLDLVNPEDIETVTVLKDAASAAIYGARAAGGVILGSSDKCVLIKVHKRC